MPKHLKALACLLGLGVVILIGAAFQGSNYGGSGGGVTSVTGDGSLITNSSSTGAVTLTLGSTPALPSGSTATTQAAGDNSTKLATTAYADLDKILTGGNSAPAAPVGSQFLVVNGLEALIATSANACTVMPRAGTVDKLFVSLSAAEGAAATLAFTLQKGGIGQAVTCTVPNNGTTCNDTAHSFTFAAGDCLNIATVQSGTGTSQIISTGVGYR